MTATGALTAQVTQGPNACDPNAPITTTQDGGFSLQLNTYAQPGATDPNGNPVSVIQFILIIANKQATATVQFWYDPPVETGTPTIGTRLDNFPAQNFGPPRSSNTIDTNSVLTIALNTPGVPGNQGAVTEATFTVAELGGAPSSAVFSLPDGWQYPISAFQVNLVGPDCCNVSDFSVSGGATLEYSAAGTLCVQQGSASTACGESYGVTLETSNAYYGAISPCCGPSLTQEISIPT